MIWSIAWRNIWRNKTRSLVIITAITLGIFAGVFIIAFLYGWVQQRIDAVIQTEVSHIQLHHPAYLSSQELTDYMVLNDTLQKALAQQTAIQHHTTRLLSSGMIASAETKAGVQLIGVVPETEIAVTNLHTHLVAGTYLEGIKRNPIVIGQQLAKTLNVKLRSKLVITLSEMDGTLTKATFRVAGIYTTANTAYDETKVFVRQQDLRRLLKAPASITHEIAILVHENGVEDAVVQELGTAMPTLDIATWKTLMPEIQMMHENMSVMTAVFVGIILLALGFGIVNTMLMVILERIPEIGMTMAIGMNTRSIFLMILAETLCLAMVGGLVGILLALVLIRFTQYTGIDLSLWAAGLQATGFDTVIYPQITLIEILKVTCLVILTGILAALYPAKKAISLNPSEALRTR